MSEKFKAADDIRNLARIFKNMTSVADQLESIGQIEQAQAEREVKLAATKLELTGVEEALEQSKWALVRADGEIEDNKASAEKAAAAQLQVAEQTAADLMADAKRGALEHMKQAEQDAERIIDQAVTEKNKIDAEAAKLAVEISLGLRKQADAQVELDRLTAAIAGAREQISKLMATAV